MKRTFIGSLRTTSPSGLGTVLISTIALMAAGVLVSPRHAVAGPPFLADDPEPVELHHWEFYLASQVARSKDKETVGTAPHFEVNYGVLPETQLHLIAPLAYVSSPGQKAYGPGDMELGIKYRFIKETDSVPQIGAFPLLEVPTGDENRGLGNGQPQAFFPLWAQKSFGPWTTYGGGGYWVNPGDDNRNFWFTSWLLQRKITDSLTLGGEVYNYTTSTRDGQDRVGFNLGGFYDISEHVHVLFSCGHDIHGPEAVIGYVALQVTY